MSDILAQLAAAAVSGGSRANVQWYTQPVEEARSSVVVKDKRKKPAEDGSQLLGLQIGRQALPLDVVKPGATHIESPAENIESFSEALLSLVTEGKLDEAIAEAQTAAKEAAEKAAEAKAAAAKEGKTVSEEQEGLDLGELDA